MAWDRQLEVRTSAGPVRYRESGSGEPLVPYSRLAWLPDGYRVVFASDQGSVKTYDHLNGEQRIFPATTSVVALLTVSTAEAGAFTAPTTAPAS